MGPIKNLGLIFVDPAKAFADIFADKRNSAFIPLAVCLFSSAFLLYAYYAWVNFPWLNDKLYTGYSGEQQAALQRVFTKPMLQLTGMLGVFVVVPIIDAALALYISLVTKLQGANSRFADTFRLVCWGALPIVLLLPAGLVGMYLDGSGRMMPEDLNPVSLNKLVFHVTRPSPYLTLLSNLNLIAFWQIALMVIGFRKLTGASIRSAAAIVCAPYVLIYGGWILIIAIGQIG